jgi:hypothetical protein
MNPKEGEDDNTINLGEILFPEGNVGDQFPVDFRNYCDSRSIDPLADTEMLYHYTDADGLLGIVGNDCLRFTAAAYLNDKREILHGLEVVRGVLGELQSGESFTVIRETYESTLKQTEPLAATDFYVCAFSGSADVKSQWVDYAARGYGYAIGFERDSLVSLVPTPIPFPVFYDSEMQKDLVRHVLMQLTERITARLRPESDQTVPVEERLQIAADLARAFTIYTHILIPGLKHSGFSEELEFRWVLPVGVSKAVPPPICFRERKGMVVPYVEVRPPDGEHLPIREVVLGPMLDLKRAEHSVGKLLDSKGHRDVHIRQSEIPLA